MIRIALAPVLDQRAITEHQDQLRQALNAGENIEISCEAVEQAGLAGLQLLASALRSGRERGVAVTLAGASGALTATSRLAGMDNILFPAPGAAS